MSVERRYHYSQGSEVLESPRNPQGLEHPSNLSPSSTSILLITAGESDSPSKYESALKRRGHTVNRIEDGNLDIEEFHQNKLVVVDATSPHSSWRKIVEALRRVDPQKPIVLIVGKDKYEKQAIVGGDENIQIVTSSKRDNRKLLNCVDTLSSDGWEIVLNSPNLNINLLEKKVGRTTYRAVEKNGERKVLSRKVARLLQAFMEREGEILTRRYLMKKVWETDYMGDTRTLDVHVSWLREAIEKDPSKPEILKTLRGLGYQLG